jgi:hypothetical protein
MALDFELISGLPCIGIIDCSHHCIKAPAGTKAESDVFSTTRMGTPFDFQPVVDPYRRIYDIRYGMRACAPPRGAEVDCWRDEACLHAHSHQLQQWRSQ